MPWWSCIVVLLFIFIIKNGFCGVVQNERITRSAVDILTSPALYALARLPITSTNTDPKSESSDHVHQKILQPPLAFSYNEQPGKQDLTSSATHNHADGDAKNHKSGGGKSHQEEHYEGNAEKSGKGYKGYHEHEKKEKGHHDKEGHKGSYSDKGGKTQKKSEEDSYHALHQKVAKGEKGSKFKKAANMEKVTAQKVDTRLIKKITTKRTTNFSTNITREATTKNMERSIPKTIIKKAVARKAVIKNPYTHGAEYGKEGHFGKGSHYDEDLGHKKKAGHDEHHAHVEKYGKKNSEEGIKAWGYKKGDGAKAKIVDVVHDNEKYSREDDGEVDDAAIEKEQFTDDNDHSSIGSVSPKGGEDTDSVIDAVSKIVPSEAKDEINTSNVRRFTVKGPNFEEDHIKETDYVFAKPPRVIFDNGEKLKRINAQALQQPAVPIASTCGN